MLEAHPLADLFPMMSARESEDLRGDLAANGLSDPIITYEGRILDGRNRYAACVAIGIVPHTRGYTGPDPLAFVLSKNLHRRHLSESQRSMVAAKIATMGEGRPAKETPPIGGVSAERAAELLNVGVRSVERARHVREHGVPALVDAVSAGEVSVAAAEKIAALSPEEQREILEFLPPAEVQRYSAELRRKKNIARRDERVRWLGDLSDESAKLTGVKRYPILYADPPWRFEAGDSDRSVENHYPTMTVEQIAALPLGDLATDGALLLLWTTAPHLVTALDCLKIWGFTYKSHLAWDKEVSGTGFWFLSQHEVLIAATRGDFPAPLQGRQLKSIWRERKGRHSAKPLGILHWIDAEYPGVAKLELFCRDPQPGWDVWGNQAAKAA